MESSDICYLFRKHKLESSESCYVLKPSIHIKQNKLFPYEVRKHEFSHRKHKNTFITFGHIIGQLLQ